MKQQIREATAFGVQPRILIHDNDGIYGQFGKDRRSHLGYRSHLDYWLKETTLNYLTEKRSLLSLTTP